MGLSESEIFGWPELKIEERKQRYRLLKKQGEAMGQDYVIREKIRQSAEAGKLIRDYLNAFDKMFAQDPIDAYNLKREVSSQIDFIKTEEKKAEKRIQNALIVDKENPENKNLKKDYEAIRAQLIIAVDLFSKSSRRQQDRDGKSKAAALAETIRANLKELDTEEAKEALQKAGKPLTDTFRSQAHEAVVIGETIKKGLNALSMRLEASERHKEKKLTQKQIDESIVAIAKMQAVEPLIILDIDSPELRELSEGRKIIGAQKQAAKTENKAEKAEKTETKIKAPTVHKHGLHKNNG